MMKYWVFIIELHVQHRLWKHLCQTKVKEGVLSTKYPYVDALPSTGKIPISNHVLVTCVFTSSWDHKYVADIST